MPLAGGTFTNVFNYTNANNQLSGIITASSLTMGNITIVAIASGGQADNDKIPTKGYVDTLFSQYNPNLFVLVAGGTYNNIYSFENVLNRFGGLFTGKVITNDFTLDNKQMTSITTGGNTNNDKLTTQGYVDSMISQVGTQVTNNYYNKTYIDTELGDINTQLGNINTTIGGLATTAALTAGLALKADKSNTYTKTEIDNMFDGVVPVGDNVGKKYPNSYGGEIFNFYTVDDTTTPPTKNIASGNYSHAENYMTTASGSYSHVEGYISTASGTTSHAEGYMTKAVGSISHAEGQETKADGPNSHAEGSHTTAMGLDSHAGGMGTVADQSYMTAIGKYNEFNPSDLTVNAGKLFAVGNGSDDNNRSDAFVVKQNETIINNYANNCSWLNLGRFSSFCVSGILRITSSLNETDDGHYDVNCIACGYQDPVNRITVFTTIKTTEFVIISKNRYTCITKLMYGNKEFAFTTPDNVNYRNFPCGEWYAVSKGNDSTPHEHYNSSGRMFYFYTASVGVNGANYKPYFFNANGTGWAWTPNGTYFSITITNLLMKSHANYYSTIDGL